MLYESHLVSFCVKRHWIFVSSLLTYASLVLAMITRIAFHIISSQSFVRSLYSIKAITMLEQLENIAPVGFI